MYSKDYNGVKIRICIFKKKSQATASNKVVSGDQVIFCFFIWVPVTQEWSVYEIVGARIASPTDKKTPGQKGRYRALALYLCLQNFWSILMLSLGCYLYLMYFVMSSYLKCWFRKYFLSEQWIVGIIIPSFIRIMHGTKSPANSAILFFNYLLWHNITTYFQLLFSS